MADQIDYTTREVEYVLPNGPDVLGAYNDHVVTNFRAGANAVPSLLSPFRMAKLVIGEPVPLILHRYRLLP